MSVKIPFSKNILKFCRNLSFDEWNKEFTQKYSFLAQFKIVQNFHYFCKVLALVEFPSKNQFSKNCLKICRNLSFDEWNKVFTSKNSFLTQFKIVQNFHYFCKVCACRISVKNSIFQNYPKIL